jgi:hypothetical protein
MVLFLPLRTEEYGKINPGQCANKGHRQTNFCLGRGGDAVQKMENKKKKQVEDIPLLSSHVAPIKYEISCQPKVTLQVVRNRHHPSP